jgi:hypothetical protein
MHRSTPSSSPVSARLAVYGAFFVAGSVAARIPIDSRFARLCATAEEAGTLVRHAALGAAVSEMGHLAAHRLVERERLRRAPG